MDKYFMKLAYKEAEEARCRDEVPVGAIIVQNNKVIGKGYNLRETVKDPTAHAEIMAIKDASKNLDGWRLIGTTMYVTLEPCPMCAGAIVQSRIDRVVIGVKDPKLGACGSTINLLQNDFNNHYVEILWNIMEKECSDIISNFFKDLRKRKMNPIK